MGHNVAHIGAQCGEFEGQGFKMLEKATDDEINAADFTEGWTPLHWAVLADNPKAVIWLLKHGADPEMKDFAGRTAKDLVEDHWGELHMRVFEHLNREKKDVLPEPAKVKDKRIKQMNAAFKSQDMVENEFDCE